MDLKTILLIFSLSLNISLGLIIHLRGGRKKAHLAFEYTLIGIIGWCIAMIFYRLSGPETVGFWVRLLYFFPTLIPAGFILFGLYFPDDEVGKTTVISIFFLNIFAAILSWLPGAVIERVTIPSVGEKVITFGWAYYLFYLWYIPGLFSASYYILFRKYRTGSPLLKQQILYVLLGLTGASLLGMTSNLVLPTMGYFEFNWIGQVTLFIWVGSVAYAIIRHRLMDIRLVVARTLSYSILLTLIAIFYVFSLFVVGSFFLPMNTSREQLLVSVALSLIVAFTFQPLRRWLERVTDQIFFKEGYNSEELLGSLSRFIASTLDIEELGGGVIKMILSKMKASRGALVLLENHQAIRVEEVNYQQSLKVSRSDTTTLISAQPQPLVFEELPEGKIKDLLRKLDITICLSLTVKDTQIGLLTLGEKSSGDIYSVQDIEVLRILAPQLSIALQNAQAFEEIKNFSHTLEKKVDEATAELKLANTKLKEMSALKDEFVSVASHELRAPMTTIKGYLSMVLEGDTGKVDPKTKEFLDNAYEGNERMIRLVNNMLNVSRIESGRLVINLTDVRLEDSIAAVITDFKIEADQKGLKLVFRKPAKPLPPVRVDPDRIKEVIGNLVGNAVKFTEKGSVTVTCRLAKGQVVTEVADTGPGISSENQAKLFQKFSQVGDQGAVMQKGSGLGLYICKNLVEDFGGKIWLESAAGKGTSFFFSLPAVKE